MTAHAALARLEAAGVSVVPDDDGLRLWSARPIPADLVALARAEKPGLLRLVSDSESDSADIASEPVLPAPGTAERVKLDQQQARMVAGLMQQFHRHRSTTR